MDNNKNKFISTEKLDISKGDIANGATRETNTHMPCIRIKELIQVITTVVKVVL